jgi:transposase InsO family protein
VQRLLFDHGFMRWGSPAEVGGLGRSRLWVELASAWPWRSASPSSAAAMTVHGAPDEVLSHNGSQFTGRLFKPQFGSEVLFERICRENDITQRSTTVASPTTTGKIERLHLTIRLDLLDDLPPFRPLTSVA